MVICPPFGQEYDASYSTLRLLAENLVSKGLVALRIDYDGTSDSAGVCDGPGSVAAWIASVNQAMGLLRRVGVHSITLVGMRLGALLATKAAEQAGDVDRLVLWDPVYSGRAYLAEQRMLGATAFGAHLFGEGVEAPGFTFHREAVEELRSLAISQTAQLPAKAALVLTRPDRPQARAPWANNKAVEVLPALGQREMLEAGSDYGAVDYPDLEAVAGWVSERAPATRSQLDWSPRPSTAVVGRSATGCPVTETPVSLGEAGLFGILAEGERPAKTPATGTTVVFFSVAHGPRHGPDRLWVDLSRRLAGAGLRSLRVDFSGLGDSPPREGQTPFLLRAPEAFDDVVQICSALQPDDPSDVVLVGYCTSGYQVLDSAFAIEPRGVVAISPETSFRPPEYDSQRGLDPRRVIAVPRTAPITRYYRSKYGPGNAHRRGRRLALGGILRSVAAPRLSATRHAREALRRLVNVFAWHLRMLGHPLRRPSVWLPRLVGQKTDVLLVCEPTDVATTLRGVSAPLLEQLRSTGHFELVSVPDLGHAHFPSSKREFLAELIAEHLISLVARDQ